MKNILVVGKTSYIGTSFSSYVANNHFDYSVTSISSRENKWKEVSFRNYDVVYNVSGLCHADSKHGTEEMYYTVNTSLPIAIAQKAKDEGVKQFIQMSSMIVFGNMSKIGTEKNISADTVAQPCNVYGESKLNAEKGLLKLESSTFKVVIMRPPLVYGENALDNFPRLIKFAKKSPLFPNIENKQSMIYIDNFCELVRLCIDSEANGIFMPQDREYITTSKLVKDVAMLSGNKLHLTYIFNSMLILASKHINLINKVFGSITYEKSISNYFDYRYCVVDYETALQRIVKGKGKR